MKKLITKKDKLKGMKLVDAYGYWSEEVTDFLAEFETSVSYRFSGILQVYSKYKTIQL